MSINPFATEELLEEVRITNQHLQTIIQQLVQTRRPSALRRWVHDHRRILVMLPAIVAVSLWWVMMVYFLVSYLFLPRDARGQLPRIGPHYAIWPYISSIGARHPEIFMTFCTTVAFLVILSFSMLWYTGRKIKTGQRLRKLTFGLATISNIFLVLLSYFSTIENNRLHLVFTSFQFYFMLFAKFSDYFMNRSMMAWLTRRIGSNVGLPRPLVRTHWLLFTVGTGVAVPAFLTVFGVYFCSENSAIETPGTKCYTLVSIAGISEWIVSLFWMAFILVTAHDLHFIFDVREVFFSLQDYQPSLNKDIAATEDVDEMESMEFSPRPDAFSSVSLK